jgi:DNA-directed RNA polymerase subunit L
MQMQPVVSKVNNSNKGLSFTISNINVSLANALRRIILSEIPTVVFRTTPYEKNRVEIDVNTTRMNNEIIKQRISCIPVYITDPNLKLENYVIEVNKKNETDNIVYVTTEDFRIKNIALNQYLSPSEQKAIFPPDPLTGDYIELARLRPKISDVGVEQLSFKARLDYGTAKEDGAFNVACTCSYFAAQDEPDKVRAKWAEKAEQMEKDGSTKEEIKMAEKDWYLLEAKRITKENEYNFIVETVGPFENKTIVYNATRIMIEKLEKFKAVLLKGGVIKKASSTIPNCYDVTLENEDYTLGKVIEFMMYNKHYDIPERTLLYSGFIKPHPHIPDSIVRLGFKNETDEKEISTLLTTASNDAIEIYTKIGENFITEQATKMFPTNSAASSASENPILDTESASSVEESNTNLGVGGKKSQKKVQKN